MYEAAIRDRQHDMSFSTTGQSRVQVLSFDVRKVRVLGAKLVGITNHPRSQDMFNRKALRTGMLANAKLH